MGTRLSPYPGYQWCGYQSGHWTLLENFTPSERKRFGGYCRACRSLNSKVWYKKPENKQKAVAKAIKSRQTLEGRLKYNATSRAYQKRHPEVKQITTQRYDAKKKSLPCTLTQTEWLFILDVCGNQCLGCGSITSKLTQDHINPQSKGGGYTMLNIQPLCGSCNSSKGTNYIDYRTKAQRKKIEQKARGKL